MNMTKNVSPQLRQLVEPVEEGFASDMFAILDFIKDGPGWSVRNQNVSIDRDLSPDLSQLIALFFERHMPKEGGVGRAPEFRPINLDTRIL
jgi:hypothetical protein